MVTSPRGPEIDAELAAALKKCDANTPLERKEGLNRLQAMFTDRRLFQPHEMRKITECFNRLFVDTNAKVDDSKLSIHLVKIIMGLFVK